MPARRFRPPTSLALVVLCAVATFANGAAATSLDDRVPNLFPGLATSINPRGSGAPQSPPIPKALRELSAALATFRSQIPIPSTSAAYRFLWEPEVGTFVVDRQSLGPSLAERAQTPGRGVVAINASYARIDFDTLDGNDVDSLHSSQAAFPAGFLRELPPENQQTFADDLLETTLDFSLSVDQAFFSATLGVTQSIDVGIGLSISHVAMDAEGKIVLLDPDGDGGGSFGADFLPNGRCEEGDVDPRRCAEDGFHDSAFGTGDVLLRAKWNFANTSYADLAASGLVTVPTGNGDDFLGYRDATFTPALIASKTFGRFSPPREPGIRVSRRQGRQPSLLAGGLRLARPAIAHPVL